jgi:cytochrome c556
MTDLDPIMQAAERLAEKSRKVVAWLKRLEAQATAQEKTNRGRFNSLADSCKADASNYRAVAQDVQQVIDEWDAAQG